MRLSRFAILINLAAVAVTWLVTLPARAISYVVGFLPTLAEPVRLVDEPAFALDSPAPRDIEPSLYHRNRHEAGLRRLGAVRHI